MNVASVAYKADFPALPKALPNLVGRLVFSSTLGAVDLLEDFPCSVASARSLCDVAS